MVLHQERLIFARAATVECLQGFVRQHRCGDHHLRRSRGWLITFGCSSLDAGGLIPSQGGLCLAPEGLRARGAVPLAARWLRGMGVRFPSTIWRVGHLFHAVWSGGSGGDQGCESPFSSGPSAQGEWRVCLGEKRLEALPYPHPREFSRHGG